MVKNLIFPHHYGRHLPIQGNLNKELTNCKEIVKIGTDSFLIPKQKLCSNTKKESQGKSQLLSTPWLSPTKYFYLYIEEISESRQGQRDGGRKHPEIKKRSVQ